ncbi:phosphate ABC transporter substrate-binding protein PstS [Nocardioides alcanivorans]|uniref:phosphate ABC transporter substrate-binding protein PstS n=1 Tax=Nocardioides alcanivorans TaxID=2897352 RepID=UPI001F1B8EAC|nr:phosphate ABC transporter substrate-binding protein PstS [Nocardioides alcanivorans]
MIRPLRNLAAVLAALLTLMAPIAAAALAPDDGRTAARVAYAQIEGSGSTWSENIVQQWIADVDASGMKVTYSGGGSSTGRKNFAQNVTDFGISEIPYPGVDEFGAADNANGRDYAYIPIVAGGTAFTYQIKVGGKMVKNLRLSGETIAKIFTNQITNWNDPAITKDNNGRALPSLDIIPVVRGDGSGTTAQFTTWLDKEYPSLWRAYNGRAGYTSYYPRKGKMQAPSGSDQVMNTVSGFSGNGAIAYVEYSYPVNKNYPVVKVLNKGGYYVEPTRYNVAVALTKARINTDKGSQMYLTQILDEVYRAKDPRTYPLSSYSYLILPTGADDRRMTTAKRQTLMDFMYYSLCEGQSKAGDYGYSPLPLNLVQAGFEQLNLLAKADSGVDAKNRSVASCNNPTFVAGKLNENRLAKIAPMPAACDKQGAGPCSTGTGTGEPSTEDAPADSEKKADDVAAPGEQSDPDTTVDTDAPPQVDPETGEPVSTAPGSTAASEVFANPMEVSADRKAERKLFGWVAVAELLALVMLPGLAGVWLRRRALRGTP